MNHKRVTGAHAFLHSWWRDPALAGAIAAASLRNAIPTAGRFVASAAAVGLGLTFLYKDVAAQSYLWSVEGKAPWEIANTYASLSDIDCDGYREVVGCTQHWDSDRGRVEVRSGAEGDKVLLVFYGEATGDLFGTNADGAGDVDGDGVEDLIIGAPSHHGYVSNDGKIYVYSGATGALLFSRIGPTSGSRYGELVCGVGDVNVDGNADVAASTWGNGLAGRVEVLSGKDGTLIYALDGEGPNDEFGRHGLSSGIDWNQDGTPDLMISAPGWSGNRGRVYLYSGAKGNELHHWDGANAVDFFGSSAVFGGDIDGDGVRDILIGAVGYDGAGAVDIGRVYVYSGATLNLLATIDGTTGNDRFGVGLSCVGDLDGDGRDEISVWLSYFDGDGGPRSGRMLIHNSRTFRVMFELDGVQQDEYFGEVVTRAQPLGDVSGDGVPDVATGFALFDNQYGDNVGKLGVFALAPLGLESSPPQPKAGDTLTLSTLGGVSNALSLDAVVEVDGVPTFLVVGGVAPLYDNGERLVAGSVPPGLDGHVVRFRSYAIGVHGKVVTSADEVVTFQ